MRIGAIGWASNQGLGTLTLEFDRHLKFSKLLLVPGKYRSFPERFPGARTGLSASNIDWLLEDIDVLLMFETPSDWSVISLAKKRGVKTVLIPMYECAPKKLPYCPDRILCPSDIDYDVFKTLDCDVRRLDIPVNRKMIPFRQRSRAKVFQFNGGHGGLIGRNGLTELLAAIPMCKSDARFIIYTQKALDFQHPNVEVRAGNYENYWDLWGDGDVFVFPHKFDGLSLPIQEALSSGMPVISTWMYPFSKWLPKDWCFVSDDEVKLRVFEREIQVAVVNPATIAAAIDRWYDKDITSESALADRLADKLDWKNLLTEYRKDLT